MSDFLDQKIGDVMVRIDREQCIGSANCVKVGPQVFEIDEDNIVRFKTSLDPISKEHLIEACNVCPVDALTVLTPDT